MRLKSAGLPLMLALNAALVALVVVIAMNWAERSIQREIAMLKNDVLTKNQALMTRRTVTLEANQREILSRLSLLTNNGSIVDSPATHACAQWNHKTRSIEEAMSAEPTREIATCLKCLPIRLPQGLQCVDSPPAKVIEPSWLSKDCVDVESFVSTMMVNAEEGQTVVDVGLFDGALLQELAKTTNHNLIGFEPNPGSAENIQRKVDSILEAKGARKPGSARVINAGASSEPGTMMLHGLKGNGLSAGAGSSFAYGDQADATTRDMYTSKSVRVTTLDTEIDEDVYILKVDTQGWEPHVFLGALNLLRRHSVRFIVLEIAPYVLCEAGWNPMQVAELLNCLGYMCFDGRWEPTKDKTRKYTKRPQPGDLAACSCGTCVRIKNESCNRPP